jgi:alpha-L-fucosidase
MTLNEHWGYHQGDEEWKSPEEVIGLLASAAAGNGNLLLNLGPRGDGAIPERSRDVVETVGRWLHAHGECIYGTDPFTYGLMTRGAHNGDWSHNGPFTLRGKALYQIVRYWPGRELVIAGLNTTVEEVTLLNAGSCRFSQREGIVTVSGLPDAAPGLCPVLRFDCADVPQMNLTGGMRIPYAPHPPYDPCASDIVL